MIVMQYRFTLPADYEMDIIEKRIRDNGAKLDGFPGLLLKCYLYARRDDPSLFANENRYAPLYVWKNAEAMTRFLQSSGFEKLTQDFGWPQIETWLALRTPSLSDVKNSAYLSMEKQAIEPHSDLNALTRSGQLSAWDVSRWQSVNVVFTDSPSPTWENYRIGYVASEEQSMF